MATNMRRNALLLLFFLSIVTVELYTPHGAAARKLLQNEPATDDDGQHKIGALGSTSKHAGSATGDNTTLPGNVHLSPPTDFTFFGGDNNGTTVEIRVHQEILVPPGTPTSVHVNVQYPHGHPHPPPPPGSLPDPGRMVPGPSYHWP